MWMKEEKGKESEKHRKCKRLREKHKEYKQRSKMKHVNK
jgi:hypothetical protein